MNHRTNLSPTFDHASFAKRRSESVRGVLTSLAFWLCLFGAVGVYGLVVLSPKAVRWSATGADVERNHQQLLALQEQVRYWDQLTRELETNPAFRKSLISTSNAGESATQGLIPVDTALKYDRATPAVEADALALPAPRWDSLCQRVAGSRLFQVVGLATSAGMLLFAFTSLLENPPQHRRPRLRRARGRIVRRLGGVVSRYVSD